MKEGLSVKYIVTIIWGLILSQVTYYLGSALSQTPLVPFRIKAQKDRGQSSHGPIPSPVNLH